jgi:hypothetical protein
LQGPRIAVTIEGQGKNPIRRNLPGQNYCIGWILIPRYVVVPIAFGEMPKSAFTNDIDLILVAKSKHPRNSGEVDFSRKRLEKSACSEKASNWMG